MSASSELIRDQPSSLSPSADNSNMNSPITARPPLFPHESQRSSSISSFVSNTSMGSVGANTSGRMRSMSIVSLDSPRNSIIGMEDATDGTREDAYEPARMTSISPPRSESMKKTKPQGQRRDEAVSQDNEFDTHAASQGSSIHARAKKPKERKEVFSFKRNYSLEFGKAPKSNPKPKATSVNEGRSSPLSANSDENEIEPFTICIKKNKNNSISNHSPLPLKKKSIFSNDLQLEILHSSNKGGPGDAVETKFSKPGPPKPDKEGNLIHSLLSMKEQSHLIRKFNRKWNKEPTIEDATSMPLLHKKRRRSDDSENIV